MMTDAAHKQKESVPAQADEALALIADYVCRPPTFSSETYKTAALCLADTLGCGILALSYPACTKLLGPLVPGTLVPHGCRVPGTDYVLDPVQGAFNIGTMVRWLDYNDTWLAAEWGHPSDNLGALLALTDHLTRRGTRVFTVHDLLTAMIKAHEIQGGLAILNSFNRVGFDHVIFVKAASTAISAHLLGASHARVMDALSNAWIDVGPLRTYRHAPDTGSRKSWAAGDATSRGVRLALITMQGEQGYPHALTAPKWGLYDVLFKGLPFKFQRPLASYVMDHVLFKISYPAEFHAQTAVECAVRQHSLIKDRLEDIALIEIETHESAVRIIDKTGPLHNPADRDHCLQYMVAVGLLKGNLTADDYEDEAARNPALDKLRSRMTVKEHKPYSYDYIDQEKRSIANAVTIRFKDGTKTPRIEVEYPIGHPRRREEGIPLLRQKFVHNLGTRFEPSRVEFLAQLFEDQQRLEGLTVPELVDAFC